MKFRADAGLSVLELVVVLGTAAGLLVMVAASLPRPSAGTKTDAVEIAAFLSEARTRVILAGMVETLTIGQNAMTFGDKHMEWGTDITVSSVSAARSADYRLIIYPDGSYSGAALQVRSPAGTQPIPGVFRSSPADD